MFIKKCIKGHSFICAHTYLNNVGNAKDLDTSFNLKITFYAKVKIKI